MTAIPGQAHAQKAAPPQPAAATCGSPLVTEGNPLWAGDALRQPHPTHIPSPQRDIDAAGAAPPPAPHPWMRHPPAPRATRSSRPPGCCWRNAPRSATVLPSRCRFPCWDWITQQGGRFPMARSPPPGIVPPRTKPPHPANLHRQRGTLPLVPKKVQYGHAVPAHPCGSLLCQRSRSRAGSRVAEITIARCSQSDRRRHQNCAVRLATWHAFGTQDGTWTVGSTKYDRCRHRAGAVHRRRTSHGPAARLHQEN